MSADVIAAGHRARQAIVYIRQSTERQVLEHQESQRRQRELVERAISLGWPREQIVQVDEDLGQSGAGTDNRAGFRKMVAEAALGQVGIILALDASRVSRSNHDWYHLLDICAVTGTLIGDAEGVYDPRAHNDRLLLGLKATMSETELHVLKQRLVESIRAKARRGEFQFRLSAGFVWDPAGRIVKTPDDQVRSAITTIFERFSELGTVHAVHGSLTDAGIKLPVVAGKGQTLKWILPGYAYLLRVLCNPLYAGAYAFGRRQTEQVLNDAQRPRKHERLKRDPAQWQALIRDHHEGYISWETFESNQRQIAANRNGDRQPWAPREGSFLLQGLVLCGACGRRMHMSYDCRTRMPRLTCLASKRQIGGPICQQFGARRLEQRVEQLLLEALEPLGVEAMIAAANEHDRSNQRERVRWQQQVERARYELDLARRQYDAVDPANRLVARELERRFETALKALEQVEREAERREREIQRPLDAAEQAQLRAFANELATLWHADSTRLQDKKRICRALIEHIIVTSKKTERTMTADVHWVGGEVSRIQLERGRPGIHRYIADAELIENIRTLARELSDAQIARVLNSRGIKTPKGLPFTSNRVAVTRTNHGIECGPRVARQGPDIYSPHQAARILGVSSTTVIRWVEDGLLKGAQISESAPWRVQLTEADVRRLKAADAPEGWLSLKAAAQALRISQQAVLQRLNVGKLQAVRVHIGRRSSWRINVPAETCVQPATLFP